MMKSEEEELDLFAEELEREMLPAASSSTRSSSGAKQKRHPTPISIAVAKSPRKSEDQRSPHKRHRPAAAMHTQGRTGLTPRISQVRIERGGLGTGQNKDFKLSESAPIRRRSALSMAMMLEAERKETARKSSVAAAAAAWSSEPGVQHEQLVGGGSGRDGGVGVWRGPSSRHGQHSRRRSRSCEYNGRDVMR